MFDTGTIQLPLLANRRSRQIPFFQGGCYEVVCDGCPAADDGITMGVENLVPTCTETLENTRSDGANTSIEDIRIDPGYWRATTTTKTILACYNADACLGGITGEAGYCREGYYGPCKTLLEAFCLLARVIRKNQTITELGGHIGILIEGNVEKRDTPADHTF